MRKKLIIGIAILAVISVLAWAYIESTKPLPGKEELQSDRTHIQAGAKTDYKFNPPTSGGHYATWTTKGVYDTPRADGYLVHSLEHGYVIFWYDCEKKLAKSVKGKGESNFTLNPSPLTLVTTAYAHEASDSANPSSSTSTSMQGGGEGSPSANLQDMPKSFSDGSCDSLKNQVKDLYNQFGTHKLIVVPRVGMNHPLALTAWGRVLELDKIDKAQIKRFINSYRDHGPEQTNEP